MHDVSFIENQLKVLQRFSKNIKNMNCIVKAFENNVANIKKAVVNDEKNSLKCILEEFKDAIKMFQGVFYLCAPSTFKQILCSLASMEGLDEMEMYRKLQLILANQVRCKDDLTRYCQLLQNNPGINFPDFLNNIDSPIFSANQGNEIQETFLKYEKLSSLLILKPAVCNQCSERSGDIDLDSDVQPILGSNSTDMGQFPVTSTPILSHPISISSCRQLSDSGGSVIEAGGTHNDLSSQGKDKKSIGKNRWTSHETFCLYKGVQEGLQWHEIKNKYFKRSKRTNVNLKDRWRTVLLNSHVLDELRVMHQKESGT